MSINKQPFDLKIKIKKDCVINISANVYQNGGYLTTYKNEELIASGTSMNWSNPILTTIIRVNKDDVIRINANTSSNEYIKYLNVTIVEI